MNLIVKVSVFSAAPYADIDGTTISGDSAALNDPRYKSLRYEACFAL